MKIIKRMISFIVSISIITMLIPQSAFASEDTTKSDEANVVVTIGGYLASNSSVINTLVAEKKFNARQGHAFAAERANNLSDIFRGKNSSIVGDNNAKNGADRMVISRNGETIFIQDKYYSTAERSIDACWDENGFRYVDADNNLMKIEVPKDQYEAAVKRMAQKIEEGKVPGVTDPAEASNIVKKGNVTYKQAVNIAKSGNIDSLVYDAKNGVISTSGAFAISVAIDYYINRVNGVSIEDSLKDAVIVGFETGAQVFASYVISSQLSRVFDSAFKPTSEAIVKKFGSNFAESVLTTNGVKSASTLSKAQLTTKAASMLRSQVLFAVVTVAVLETGDVIEIFRGRISKEQFISNLSVVASSTAVAVGGYYGGGAIGTLICPGVGTVIGSFVGSIVTGVASYFFADWVAKQIYEGDGAKMYKIVENTFSELSEEYLITKDEAEAVAEKVGKKLTEKELKNMYESKDRVEFSKKLMEPLFESQIAKRPKIEMPNEEDIRKQLKNEMEGIVFIH